MSALIPTKTIDQLTAYSTPLLGNEELEIFTGANQTRKITARDLVLPIDSLITISGMSGSLPGSRQLVDSTSVVIEDGGAGGQLKLHSIGSDSDPAGYQLYTAVAPVTLDDFALNAAVGFLDFDTTAGQIDLDGIVASFNGQRLTISCIGTNTLVLHGLAAGSAAANQFRSGFDLNLLQYMTTEIRYSTTIGKWVVLP